MSEFVSHACALGLEVASVVGVGLDDDGYVVDDFESVAFEAYALYGVVGDEAYLADAEVAQYFGSYSVFAFVGLEAEVFLL